jgi:hypothetical protein
MTIKRAGMYALGWLSIITGYGLSLALFRGVYLGITRGFRADHSQALWIVLGYLLFLGLAVYIFIFGRRTLSTAKGNPPPPARFGWGRILLGTIFLYSSAVDHFHLMPAGPIKRMEPSNETQAVGMTFATIVLVAACCALVLSGLWRGFRPHVDTKAPNSR